MDNEKKPREGITGVDVNLLPRDGGERRFQFEKLEDGSVTVTLLWFDPVRRKTIEVDSMRALPGDEVDG